LAPCSRAYSRWQEAQMTFLAYLLTMALEEAKTEKAKTD
jgi:hypothetical protein